MVNNNTLKAAYFALLSVACFVVAVVLLFPYLPQVSQIMSGKEAVEEKAPAHVIVVGGGLAGLSATIEAHRHGARVTIIEKEKGIGGNSAKATSGINGVGTDAQKVQGVADSVQLFVQDTTASGAGLANPDLVNLLATNSAEAHVFLRSFGLNLTDVIQLGGHSTKRTHRIPPTPEGKPIPVGFTIVSTLKKYIENDLKNLVTVLPNSLFKKLVTKGQDVIGVQYSDVDGNLHELHGTVVLTAGGFANDHTSDSLLVKYAPEKAQLPTTNGGWATGDVIKGTLDQHLSLIHMNKVQVHPTGFVEPKEPHAHTKFLAPEALRGCGAILLNHEGRRFVNELGRRDYVTENIFKNCKKYLGEDDNPVVAAMLLTQDVIDRFGAPAVGFYKFKGLMKDYGSLDAVAESMKVQPQVLKDTLKSYREAVERGEDEFGKKAFPQTFSEGDHFFLAYITPTLHYCMGGIEIDATARAIRKSDDDTLKKVGGLFAAGEVSGGVHGENRLGGNSLLECVVFGRIAGRNAAHHGSQL